MSNKGLAFIIVSASDFEAVKRILVHHWRSYSKIIKTNELECIKHLPDQIAFRFEDVFYGNLYTESNLLISHKIAHSIYWASGLDYSNGEVHYNKNKKGCIVYIPKKNTHLKG